MSEIIRNKNSDISKFMLDVNKSKSSSSETDDFKKKMIKKRFQTAFAKVKTFNYMKKFMNYDDAPIIITQFMSRNKIRKIKE